MTGSYAGSGIVSDGTTSVSLLNLEQLTFIGGSAAGAAARSRRPHQVRLHERQPVLRCGRRRGRGGTDLRRRQPGASDVGKQLPARLGGVRSDKLTCSHGVVDRELPARSSRM